MIKTRKGVTEINGTRIELLIDIAVIFKSLLEGTDITREEIIEALDDAEKLEAELDEKIKNIDEGIKGLLEEIMQKIKEMEEAAK